MTLTRPAALLIALALLFFGPASAAAAPQDEVSPEPVAETDESEPEPEPEPEAEEPEEEAELVESEVEAESEAEAETEAEDSELAAEVETEAAEVETKEPEKKEGEKKDEDGEEDETLEVGGRVHVGFNTYHYHDEGNEWDDTFVIRRARLRLHWRPEDWVDAKLQVDAAEAFGAGNTVLKDAWVRLKPLDELEFRMGVFKKPFSGLELTSSADLKVIERGVANKYVVAIEDGELSYGDRDLGLEIGGRILDSVKLDYAIGVFNGTGLAFVDFENAKDVAARLSMRPIKLLTIGVSGALRFYDDSWQAEGYPPMAVAGEADIGLRIAGFRAHLEGLVAHNYYRYTDPVVPNPGIGELDAAFGALGILSYKFKIPSEVKLALEPVVRFEYFDPSDYIIDDHVFLYTIGFNTYVGKYFRVMLDFEIMRAERNWEDDSSDQTQEVADHQERLLLLLCFDI